MPRCLLLLALTFPLMSATGQAQQYPDHPIRVVVGYAAGGGPDIQARTLAAQLSLDLGQQVFVENRTGANGTIGARAVAQSKPDGYTLLFSSNGIAPTPFIYRNPGFDVLTDLMPIATIGVLDGLFMLVDAKSPYKTLQEFLDHAKKDRAVFGSPGVGNGLHLAAEIFSKKAGITMQHVPYKGASEVMTGMLSGSIEVMFVTPPSVMGLLAEGRIRALAFTGSKAFPAFPNVPLMKDMVPGFEPVGSWGMFFAPAKTPPEIIQKLNASVRAALQAPAVASVMQRDGYIPDNRNVAETAAYFRKEVELMGDAVKAAGIEPN
jgi:tripartite-type tricarboxylate transporter receptor subunit TctC